MTRNVSPFSLRRSGADVTGCVEAAKIALGRGALSFERRIVLATLFAVLLMRERPAAAWAPSETSEAGGAWGNGAWNEGQSALDGSIGLEGMSYLNPAATAETGGPGSYTALAAKLSASHEGSVFEAVAKPEGEILLNADHSIYAEMPEGYVATSRELSPNLSLALGRKLEDWNRLDETWELGIWQPRYRWDYLNPEQVALTGATLEGHSGVFSFQFFATPVFIPERGVPVDVTGGSVTAGGDGHWFIPPPATAQVMGQSTPVLYNLAMPSLSSIVMNPGTSLRVRVGPEEGPWTAGAWALKPMNQLLLATDGFLNASQSDQPIDATIHPRVVYDQLWSAEAGYRQGRLDSWISLLQERPIMDVVPDTWIAQEAVPSLAISPGVSLKLEDLPDNDAPARLSASYLWQRGGNAADSGDTAISTGTASIYESRYPFQDAVMVEGNSPVPGPWGRSLSGHSRALYDLDHEGLILSGDFTTSRANAGPWAWARISWPRARKPRTRTIMSAGIGRTIGFMPRSAMFSDQRTKTGRQPEICTPDFRSSRCRSSFFGLLCAALLGLSSCLQFDRTPVSSQPLTFDPGSAQCLGKSSVTLTNLVEGNGDAASVNALFDCARDSLGLFVQNVKGADPSYYAPTELRAFMEKYFLGGTTISDPLLAQTMILKTVLFGGAATQIAPAEITAALNLLETTRQQALALLPWFPLTSEHLEQLSPGDFAAAVGAIQGAMQALSNVLGTVGQSYAFSDFSAFLQDLIPILDSPDARASLASLQAQLGGISDLKQLLSPSPDAAIGGQEWAGLFGDASTAYTLWLTYWNLNARLGSFMVGDGRVAFVGWTGQRLAFLDQVVSRHGDAGVAQAELNQLASDWLGSSVTVAGFPVDLAIFEQTLTPILSRVLTGDVFDSSHHRVLGSGLNHAVVAKLEQYLAEWNAGQAYVEAAFTSAGDGDQITTDGSAPAGALGFCPRSWRQLPPGDPGTGASPIAFASEQRLRELIEAPETWQLFAPRRGEISFPEPLNDRHHSFNDLTTLNWMYEIAFMLMRGYIDDPTRMPPETGALGQSLYQSGAMESEVARFYQDFKPFGVAIKLFAPDDDSVPADRFRDANLFLYASNGDNLLDPEEGQQLLAFLVSADRLADRFHFAIGRMAAPRGPWISTAAHGRCPVLSADALGESRHDSSATCRGFSDTTPGSAPRRPRASSSFSSRPRGRAVTRTRCSARTMLSASPRSSSTSKRFSGASIRTATA